MNKHLARGSDEESAHARQQKAMSCRRTDIADYTYVVSFTLSKLRGCKTREIPLAALERMASEFCHCLRKNRRLFDLRIGGNAQEDHRLALLFFTLSVNGGLFDLCKKVSFRW